MPSPDSTTAPPMRESTIRARLAELGHELPTLPEPSYSYLIGRSAGDHVYVSGQTPKVDGELVVRGLCGNDVDLDQAAKAAELCAVNAIAALRAVTDLERVESLVKVTVFVASAVDFRAQADVADAASVLLEHALGPRGRHARTAVGVACLPGGAPVEVELSAYCPQVDRDQPGGAHLEPRRHPRRGGADPAAQGTEPQTAAALHRGRHPRHGCLRAHR